MVWSETDGRNVSKETLGARCPVGPRLDTRSALLRTLDLVGLLVARSNRYISHLLLSEEVNARI